MTETNRPLKVFLCHARSDATAVRTLYNRLVKDGVDAWLDKEKLLPGQDWELEIRKAVHESDVVVVCHSKQFNQKAYRQKEVRIALEEADLLPKGEIFIIPARLEECDVLEDLQRWQWVDLFEKDGYERLMLALRARANKIGATLLSKKIWLPNITSPRSTSDKLISIKATDKPKEKIVDKKEKTKDNLPTAIDNFPKGWDESWQPSFEKAEINKSDISAADNFPEGWDESWQPGFDKETELKPDGTPKLGKTKKSPRELKTPIVIVIGIAIVVVAVFAFISQFFKPAYVPKATSTAFLTQVPISTFTALSPSETSQPSSIPKESFTSMPSNLPEVYDPHPKVDDYHDSFGAPMRLIPSGNFTMGSNNDKPTERPAHTVYLDNYYIDKYDVTNVLYKACVDAGKCQPPKRSSSYTRNSYYGNSDFDNYPVVYVDWNMAHTYCEWRVGRLPTEAEWEKASSTNGYGTQTIWGHLSGKNTDTGWQGFDTTEVGYVKSASKSSYGGSVYDLLGNVWEWVNDWYSEIYYQVSPSKNPLGPDSGAYRVLRGSSWDSGNGAITDSPYRGSGSPDSSYPSVGFRCARSVP